MNTLPRPSSLYRVRFRTMQAADKKTLSTSDGQESTQTVSELERSIHEKEQEILSFNSRFSSAKSYPKEPLCTAFVELNKTFIPSHTEEIDVLLIGKTGNGKSAVGNTILGYNAFESVASLDSVTRDATYNVSEWNGYKFKVVDGPGVSDTRMSANEATEIILKAMSEAICLSPQGFHAFLLVVKFGGRFTAEDKLTVDTMKKIFGEHFFKKFCILVMTCGDKFEEEVNIEFEEWVTKQRNEVFMDLLNECNGRILLIDNKTKNEEKRKRQLIELVKVIETLKKHNCRYSDEHFSTALHTRNELLIESQKEFIEEKIMNEARFIQQKLEFILNKKLIHKSVPLFLNKLYKEAYELYKRIEQIDQHTGVLNSLAHHVWSIMKSIRDQIKLSENMINETRRIKREREEQANRHAKELKLQREEFDKLVLQGKRKEKEKWLMLQKQIDELNETKERWEEEDEKFARETQEKWAREKEKIKKHDVDLQQLNTKTPRLAEKTVSKSILIKLKHKLFFSKKASC